MLLFSVNFISLCFKRFSEHYYTPGQNPGKKNNKIMNEYILTQN